MYKDHRARPLATISTLIWGEYKRNLIKMKSVGLAVLLLLSLYGEASRVQVTVSKFFYLRIVSPGTNHVSLVEFSGMFLAWHYWGKDFE